MYQFIVEWLSENKTQRFIPLAEKQFARFPKFNFRKNLVFFFPPCCRRSEVFAAAAAAAAAEASAAAISQVSFARRCTARRRYCREPE